MNHGCPLRNHCRTVRLGGGEVAVSHWVRHGPGGGAQTRQADDQRKGHPYSNHKQQHGSGSQQFVCLCKKWTFPTALALRINPAWCS